jgi:hypothetical protein
MTCREATRVWSGMIVGRVAAALYLIFVRARRVAGAARPLDGSVALGRTRRWRSSRAEEAGRMRRPRAAGRNVDRSAFAGFRFPPEVITLAVRWYLRYGLSYRDAEELLAERGIEVDHVTVYRWVHRVGLGNLDRGLDLGSGAAPASCL